MKIVLTVLILLAAGMCISFADDTQEHGYFVAPTTITYLLNGELENNDKPGNCQYWDKFGMHWVCPQEVRPINGITAWWISDNYNICPPWSTGQPEMKWESAEERVFTGDWSLHWFTFWRCQQAGIMQRIRLGPEQSLLAVTKSCKVTAEFSSWFSQCSEKPFAPPLGDDCETPLLDSHMRVRIGISDHGFLNPPDDNVNWGEWAEGYGNGLQPVWYRVESPEVPAVGSVIWILEVRTNWPLKHEDFIVDSIHLECN